MPRHGEALILSVGMVLSALILSGPAKPDVGPTEPQVVHLHHLEAPKLSDADERLFGRLQARIDHRIEARIVEACDEAESKRGIGTGLLAGALLKLVAVAVKGAVTAVVFAVLVAIFWRYCWWLALAFAGAVVLVAAPTAWLVSRRK